MTRSGARLTGPLRSARAAFAFLTRIPVGGFPYTPAEWAGAPAHFPLVGLALGAVLACVHRAAAAVGPWPAAVLVIAASMGLTGALHEDGLADTFDAMGGAQDRARLFEILKDSRIGTFGACALASSLLARVTLLERIGSGLWWTLPLVGGAARVGPVWQLVVHPYVSGDASKSRDLAHARWPHAVAATGWMAAAGSAAVIAGGLSPGRLAAMACGLTAVTLAASRLYVKRAGGITGDFLGATEQLGEIVALLALAWRSG